MVRVQQFTTSGIESLPNTASNLIYDTDLNVLKFKNGTNTSTLLNTEGGGSFDIPEHNTTTEGLKLTGTLVTSSAAELNYNDLTTGPGTAEASKTLVLDSSSDITGINSLTATTLVGTLSTAAQPNITSVGTLDDLLVTGDVGIGTNSPQTTLEVGDVIPEIRLTDDRTTITGGSDLGKISWYSRDASFGSNYEPVAQIRIVSNNSTVAPDGDIQFLNGIDGTLSVSMVVDANGLVGIGSSNPDKKLEINSATGECLRLTYNDADGTAVNYTDLSVSATGDLTISPSGGDTTITGNLATTLSTAAQPNITSLGTLTGLVLSGTISGVTTLTATTLVGTLSTASQPNITSLGTLSLLNITSTGGNLFRLTSSNSASNTEMSFNTNGQNWNLGAYGSTGSIPDSFYIHGGGFRFVVRSSGLTGIGSTNPDKQLEINSATGDCLRLTYNDINGNAINYTDLAVSATGDLTISPSGGDTTITGNLATTLSTAAQPNITSIGTLSSLNISDTGGDLLTLTSSSSSSVSAVQFNTNDVDWEMGATGSTNGNPDSFYISNTLNRLLIGSSGLVGIGSTNPDKQLEINSTTGECLRLTYNDADGTATNYTDLAVSATGDLLISPSSGNIAVGASSAPEKLTIREGNIKLSETNGYTSDKYIYTEWADGANTHAIGIEFDYYTGSGTQTSTHSRINFVSNAILGEDIYDAGKLTTMSVLSNGNVGIGTDSPDTNLHIKNSISSTTNPILAIQGTGTAGDGLSIDFKNTSSGVTSARINNYRYDTSDIGLVFSHWNSGLVETMVLRNGNVGIGTNDPSADLEVNQTTPEIRLTDNRSSISNGNDLGKISWYSRDVSFGSNYEPVAQIKIIANNSTVAPDGDMYFLTAIDGVLSTAMVIDMNGDVIIGGTDPVSRLHIKQSADSYSGGIRLENVAGSGWNIYTSTVSDLVFNQGVNLRGFLATGTSVSNIDFTGQHRSTTNNTDINNNVINYVGLIVSSTGIYNNINNGNLYINEALPIVDLSIMDKDKKVFGVISDREDTGDRTYAQGTFVSVIDKVEGDERLIINSVGEGMIWVCDKSGNLENGDMITSSSAGGYGMVQDDDLFHNYTVGKITQDCDFSTPERYIDLSGNIITQAAYELDTTNGYKCNFVGCVYYCG